MQPPLGLKSSMTVPGGHSQPSEQISMQSSGGKLWFEQVGHPLPHKLRQKAVSVAVGMTVAVGVTVGVTTVVVSAPICHIT